MIEDLWYKNAVIYALTLESFMDGNRDGIGDFEGLMRRLDYLESLGIDAIWLGPFQTSPNRDEGYDIADFYSVADHFGSNGDFVEFMQRANSRGIRVIIDLVVNHTSDKHPWFQQARSSTDSKFRDWYVWSQKRPKNWKQGMVFPGVQKSTWTRDAEAGEYYYHRFYDFQPDLNMDNDDVRTEVRRIMGYWLALGVSGFRVDAVPFVIEGSPTAATRSLPPGAQWANFLRNHDELDLGRLTKEQRATVFERFGPEQEMQLYDRGIRRRLASMLGERSQIELAYSAMFSLPGTPVIRYGDEIGMGDDLRLHERNAVRTAMQWSSEEQGGFTAAEKSVKPVISEGPYGCAEVNVERQRRDPNSLLNWTVKMVRLPRSVRRSAGAPGRSCRRGLHTCSPSVTSGATTRSSSYTTSHRGRSRRASR